MLWGMRTSCGFPDSTSIPLLSLKFGNVGWVHLPVQISLLSILPGDQPLPRALCSLQGDPWLSAL